MQMIQAQIAEKCVFCGEFITAENIMGCRSERNNLPAMTCGGKPHAIESKTFSSATIATKIDSDRLERGAIDTVDNLAHALELPMTDGLHIKAMRESLPNAVKELKESFAEFTAENPWGE